MKKVKYKGNRTLNIPFTEEELKALEQIKSGKYTVEKLKASFELTELQTKSLLLL